MGPRTSVVKMKATVIGARQSPVMKGWQGLRRGGLLPCVVGQVGYV